METRLTELLGIEHPVMCAGMGGVSYHQVVAAVSDAGGFGWTVGSAQFDWATLIANKDREISRIEGFYEGGIKNKGGVTFHAHAKICAPNTVLLDSGERITAKTILIATGGRPSRYGDIPGAAHIATSSWDASTQLCLTYPPKRSMRATIRNLKLLVHLSRAAITLSVCVKVTRH